MVFRTVKADIVRALVENAIHVPTGIQEKVIPEILKGHDIIGVSKTGSGKTIAFVVPLLERLVHDVSGVQFLVLCPTRELAVQISSEVKKFGKYVRARVATIYGGASMSVQFEELKTATIVVGTPGRVLDHLSRHSLSLAHVKCVVLDEADKMASMGFIQDMRKILNHTPKSRQVLLFGATTSKDLDRLSSEYMKNPIVIRDEEQVAEEFLEQCYYDLEQNEKFSYLVHLLKQYREEKIIIFCSARHSVKIVARNLSSLGFRCEMIHGEVSQSKRLSVIRDFASGRFPILVASAVASRGLDIKNVNFVINYDLSKDPEEYIHRIGRTARAGEKGIAVTLLSHKDHDPFRQVLSRYRIPVKRLETGEFESVRFVAREHSRPAQHHHGRGRPSWSGKRGFPRRR